MNLASSDLEHTINQLSVNAVWIGSIIIIAAIIIAVLCANRTPKIKLPLFMIILVTTIGTTLTISGGTVYLNVRSATGGPVHWHADFEIWACDNEINLRDPRGLLSNKIGSPTLHEHNDKRIHLEGVPVTLPQDASLGKFMQTVGGELSQSNMIVPLNDDRLFENGDGEDGDGQAAPNPVPMQSFIHTTPDGQEARFTTGQQCGEEPAAVQVFAYNYDQANKTYRQHKLEDPASYAITGRDQVPPGDCVIFEFGPTRDRTDKLCKQYGVRDVNRCAQFGVTQRRACDITEVQ